MVGVRRVAGRIAEVLAVLAVLRFFRLQQLVGGRQRFVVARARRLVLLVLFVLVFEQLLRLVLVVLRGRRRLRQQLTGVRGAE
ncbi:hypothetical protein ACIBEA_27065 [Streptomyces sp. NPDC051555]|uniref:hypothetical protein n=1 Tax=Streptomyces sp. NPDC051555 TaxID=3365657 RepID=UPI0037886471